MRSILLRKTLRADASHGSSLVATLFVVSVIVIQSLSPSQKTYNRYSWQDDSTQRINRFNIEAVTNQFGRRANDQIDPCSRLYFMNLAYEEAQLSRWSETSLPMSFPYEMEKERELDKPTQTWSSRISSPTQPSQPKIVILGATGRIGRRIVRRLMASGIDMTVVAFVRSHDKACDVLYDDGMLLEREKRSGPKLHLVIGDLVPPSEVFSSQKEMSHENDKNADDAAYSAAQFYGESVNPYLEQDSDDADLILDPNQVLMNAIEDASVIISSVGTIRATWPFADYFWYPWRIFQSPKFWCKDPRHPYYVNYHVMKKVLSLAEAEQLRRDAIRRKEIQDNEEIRNEARKRGLLYEPDGDTAASNNTARDRIKIIRISDLCVANPAWSFVSVLTNIFRSVVFQSQDMAEIILERNDLVDTIVLRPGDLRDDDRNASTTSLQIDTTGKIQREWSPSYVGRDDIAALAVGLALTDINAAVGQKERMKPNRLKNRDKHSHARAQKAPSHARHITLGVRWAGEHLSQGRKKDGLPSVEACIESIVKQEAKKEDKIKMLEEVASFDSWARFQSIIVEKLQRRRMKPYGLFVFLPLFIIYPMIFSIFRCIVSRLPVINSIFSFFPPLFTTLKNYFPSLAVS